MVTYKEQDIHGITLVHLSFVDMLHYYTLCVTQSFHVRYSPGDVGLKIYVSGINVVQPKATLPSIAEFLVKISVYGKFETSTSQLDMVRCCCWFKVKFLFAKNGRSGRKEF